MLKFFAEKNVLTFFQQKISEYCILNPLSYEMTLNELVKLSML